MKLDTRIRFKADPEIFTETTAYEYEILAHRLRELAYLNRGLRITITDERVKKNEATSITTKAASSHT